MARTCVNCGREFSEHVERRCPPGLTGTWDPGDDPAPVGPHLVGDHPNAAAPPACVRCGKPESEHGGLLSHRFVAPAAPEPEPIPLAEDPNRCRHCGETIEEHTAGGYCKAKGHPTGAKFTPGGAGQASDGKVQTSANDGRPQILIMFAPEKQETNVQFQNFLNLEFVMAVLESARIVIDQHRQQVAAQNRMAALSSQPMPASGFDLKSLGKGRPS